MKCNGYVIREKNRLSLFLILIGFLLQFNACGLPSYMRVGEGISPENQDEDVRFRTIYYFRVTKQCGEEVVKDALYRFRMTGKANALGTKVRFESGILHKDQIDPFGTTVVYDTEDDGFRVVSYQDARDESARSGKIKTIKQYMKLRNDLRDSANQGDVKQITDSMDKKILEAVQQLEPSPEEKASSEVVSLPSSTEAEEKLVEQLKTPETAPESITIAGKADGDSGESSVLPLGPEPAESRATGEGKRCSDGSEPRKGFQVLGPQGWRTFDPDERLMLAMSTSAKPIISTMQEYSRRLSGFGGMTAEGSRPLLEERLRLLKAQRELERLKSMKGEGEPKDAKDVFDNIRNALKKQP